MLKNTNELLVATTTAMQTAGFNRFHIYQPKLRDDQAKDVEGGASTAYLGLVVPLGNGVPAHAAALLEAARAGIMYHTADAVLVEPGAVNAGLLEEVFVAGNGMPSGALRIDQIPGNPPRHSISVGDLLIVTSDLGFICRPFGWGMVDRALVREFQTLVPTRMFGLSTEGEVL